MGIHPKGERSACSPEASWTANDDLRGLCHDDRRGEKELGAVGAKKLRARLDDLAATTCLEEMRTLPGRIHPLKYDRAGELALDLDGGCRLVFRPCEPVPRKSGRRARPT